jgi:hypothetical protein
MNALKQNAAYSKKIDVETKKLMSEKKMTYEQARLKLTKK